MRKYLSYCTGWINVNPAILCYVVREMGSMVKCTPNLTLMQQRFYIQNGNFNRVSDVNIFCSFYKELCMWYNHSCVFVYLAVYLWYIYLSFRSFIQFLYMVLFNGARSSSGYRASNIWTSELGRLGPELLRCWDCGFEFRHRHGCLSLANFVCCQVQVSATGRSLVQRIPIECLYAIECDQVQQ
jgi:hypothetical protein